MRIAAAAVAALLVSAVGLAQEIPERRALVIGNSSYDPSDGTLPNARHDAEDFGNALRRAGFDVVVRLDLTKSEIESAVAELGTLAGDKPGIVLFYYAGHGIAQDGISYLLPVGKKYKNSLATVEREAVDSNKLVRTIGAAKGRASVIILDACKERPGFKGGLGRLEEPLGIPGTYIAYATAPMSVAADGVGRNSPYTAALIKHLETPGLDITNYFIEVRREVLQSTKGQQRPSEWNLLVDAPPIFTPGTPETLDALTMEIVRLSNERLLIEERARQQVVIDTQRRELTDRLVVLELELAERRRQEAELVNLRARQIAVYRANGLANGPRGVSVDEWAASARLAGSFAENYDNIRRNLVSEGRSRAERAARSQRFEAPARALPPLSVQPKSLTRTSYSRPHEQPNSPTAAKLQHRGQRANVEVERQSVRRQVELDRASEERRAVERLRREFSEQGTRHHDNPAARTDAHASGVQRYSVTSRGPDAWPRHLDSTQPHRSAASHQSMHTKQEASARISSTHPQPTRSQPAHPTQESIQRQTRHQTSPTESAQKRANPKPQQQVAQRAPASHPSSQDRPQPKPVPPVAALVKPPTNDVVRARAAGQ